MVRLKVPPYSLAVGNVKFQFLMVRLKDNSDIFNNWLSRFQFLMVRLKVKPEYNIRTDILFQFLMVRLKDKTTRLKALCIYISIPYGSIKSKSA